MIDLNKLAEKIKGETSVALFLHIRPDGDAIGSALALKGALTKLGIKVDAYCDDTIPERFWYLKGATEIKNGEIVGKYSAFVAVDSAEINRLGKYAVLFNEFKNTYLIDHHETNHGYSKNDYVLGLSANCVNVFALINELNVEIDSDIANALATGILTDTGNLKHKGVEYSTIHTLATLVEKGANLNLINYKMFTAQSPARAKLFGLTMQKIRYFMDGKIAIATVSQVNISLSGARQDETEGFIDFVMGIQGVEVGACLLELENSKYKISLRGKSTNVAEIAEVFGGGGHILASGCQIKGDYEEVVDKLVYACKQHIKE